MAKIKITAEYEETNFAVEASLYLSDLYRNNDAVLVRQVEQNVFLPIYCSKDHQVVVETAVRERNGFVGLTVE